MKKTNTAVISVWRMKPRNHAEMNRESELPPFGLRGESLFHVLQVFKLPSQLAGQPSAGHMFNLISFGIPHPVVKIIVKKNRKKSG